VGLFRGVELVGLELSGPRLTLRPWRTEDVDDIVAIMADDRMRTFLTLPTPYTRADGEDFALRFAPSERAAGRALECAVADTATGRLVGAAALRLAVGGRDPDIGYWIAPEAQGRGYAAEATRVLSAWAFERGVARIELQMDVRNVGSIRTALAAGYRFDGARRAALSLPDGWHDLATFGRLATDTADPIRPALPPLPAGGLSDGTLGMRVLAPGDVAGLVQQEADPVTIATGFTGSPPSVVELEHHAARAALDWLVGLGASFALIDLASGRFAGTLRIRTHGPPQIGGIGYVVHPDFRGRGYTTRALRLVADWAFGWAGFARLELGAKVSNLASQRAALAAGFAPDGTMAARLRNPDGSFSDEARFALVNPRYRPGQAPSTSRISP
jgi:RimJ/RimL family protein N-acetyltransferase